MKLNIRNIDINYIQYGEGEDVILLHGWGQNIQMMDPIGKNLCKSHKITIIDLPGFGESEEPKEELNIYDYADILKELVDKLKIKKPTLIGHSFGGRIAIIYGSKYPKVKLSIIGFVLSIIRIPYLLNEVGIKYGFMTTEMLDIVMLILGVVCIITFVLSLIFKRKLFIINLLSGILLFITGDILGNIIGILIIIDSIRYRKEKNK